MAHILVVDDDEILQDLLTFALELENHTVTVASDGHAALTRLAQIHPDLMIVDLHMPVMDGIRFLTEVKDTYAAPPPALVLSASGGPALQERLIELGARDVIRKPVDMAQLKARVAETLATPSAD